MGAFGQLLSTRVDDPHQLIRRAQLSEEHGEIDQLETG